MKRKYSKIIVVIVVVAVLAGILSFLVIHNNKNVKLDVGIRLLENRNENYTLQLEVENKGCDFDGIIRLLFDNVQLDAKCAYDTEVKLSSHQKTRKMIVIPMTNSSQICDRGNLFVMGKNGKKLQRIPFRNLLKGTESSLMMGVLSGYYAQLDYLSMNDEYLYIDNQPKPVSLQQLDARNLEKELKPLSFLVVDDYDLKQLRKEEIQAVVQWVKKGGWLILGKNTGAGKKLEFLGSEVVKAYEKAYESDRFPGKVCVYGKGSLTVMEDSFVQTDQKKRSAEYVCSILDETMYASKKIEDHFCYDEWGYLVQNTFDRMQDENKNREKIPKIYSVTLQPADEAGEKETYFCGTAKGKKPWMVKIKKAYRYAGPAEHSYNMNSTAKREDEFHYRLNNSGGISIGIQPQMEGQNGYFYAVGETKEQGEICAQKIRLKKDGYEGKICNLTKYDLPYLAIWSKKGICLIKDIKAKETVDLAKVQNTDRLVHFWKGEDMGGLMNSIMQTDTIPQKDRICADALWIGVCASARKDRQDENRIVVCGVVPSYERAVSSPCREEAYGCLYTVS